MKKVRHKFFQDNFLGGARKFFENQENSNLKNVEILVQENYGQKDFETIKKIIAIILSSYFRKNPIAEKKRKTTISGDVLTDSVASAGKSLGDMCFCVIIFSVFTKMVEKSGIIGKLADVFHLDGSIFSAILDITAISEISVDIPTAAALISFGGVCVFFQISAIFRGKLSVFPLVAMRIAAAVLSYGICRILQPIFISGDVTAVFAASGCMHREASPVPSVMLIIMTAVVIAKSVKIKGMIKADSE